LVPSAEHLELREDALKGTISVNGIKENEVSNAEDVMSLLQYGNRNRTTEPTLANATSSRSHAVCQVHVERHSKTTGLHAEITTAKLSLIDLAGSERASETKVMNFVQWSDFL
jgi:kinesin family protein 18/19